MPATPTQQPHILVVSNHAEAALALEQVAARRGLLVRRAHSGVQALEQAFDQTLGVAPDMIVLDDSLPDIDPLDASRALRDDPRLGCGVPILLVTAGKPTAAEHHAALRAGIWEYLAHPFRAEELGGRLDSYLQWKREAARARAQDGLADATGLYTLRGLALRARELTLQAFHHAASLACVAFAPVTHDGDNASAVELVAGVLRAMGRRSDAIGRVGPGEFAVVAPGTDRAGAVLLAERVASAVRAAARDGGLPALRAGYDAVTNARYTPIEPQNLLGRATSALRVAKTEAGAGWIRAYQ
jgi:PleD family two-component response regulator